MPTYPAVGGGGSSVSSGTAAARPAAAVAGAGALYWATDTDEISFSDGAAWHSIQRTAGNFRVVGGNLSFGTAGYIMDNNGALGLEVNNGGIGSVAAGKGLFLREGGAGAKMGTATLVAGTVTVNTTGVTANSRIFLTCLTPGGAPGFLRVSAVVAGTSFTITSSSGTDTSVVAWIIVEAG